MGSPGIVEVEVPANRTPRLADCFVGSQIDLLVFDAAPQPFDEDVVAPGALAVHADGDAVLDQHTGEGRTRELRTLVGVEDLRLAVASKSVLQRLDAECRLHCYRDAPR